MDPSMGGGILLGSYESGLRRALAIRRWHITDSIVRELREIRPVQGVGEALSRRISGIF
jgi:hypothetical protein